MDSDRPTFRQRWQRLTGTPVEFDLRPYADMVTEIGAAEAEVERLEDSELRARARRLREKIRGGEPADDHLVEAFALVREAAVRRLGQRPYDEQIIAGIAMAGGCVAEMQTGEGKTLAAVAPAFLRAFSGRGVHILTVNDYLARRDAAWMGPIYDFLGVSVGCVQEGMSVSDRRRAYACDLTYLTAKESGFDLLRDGRCLEPEDLVHRPFDFAIVDEADSILIDEDGVDWEGEGLLGPSSTWTYLVTDTPFTTGPLAAMAGRQSLGAIVAIMYWPLWIAWGFFRKWKMKREHAVGKRGDRRG